MHPHRCPSFSSVTIDRGHTPSVDCPAVDGHILPNHIVMPDDYPSRLTLVLKVLRGRADRGVGIDLATFTDLRPAFDIDVGDEASAASDGDVFTDHRIGSDGDILGQFGLGMDDRSGMNLHEAVPLPLDDCSI